MKAGERLEMNLRSLAPGRPPKGVLRMGAAVLALVMVAGCATARNERPYATRTYQSTDVERPKPSEPDDAATATAPPGDGSKAALAPRSTFARIPNIAVGAGDEDDAPAGEEPPFPVREIDAVVPPLALPAFIDLAFGEMLQVPYATGAGVANRTEIVQLRSSGMMPARTFLNLVKVALSDFGVRVSLENGVYQIIEDTALQTRRPRFIKSRSRPDTPVTLRPIVQFVELNAVSARDMTSILQQAFGAQGENLKFEPDPDSNYIVLTGLPDDVNAALSIIYEMDELRYAGTQVQRYSPGHWNAGELAREVERILTAEGWQTSSQETSPRPILLLPVAYSNDLLIFSRTPEARLRVNYWLSELDRPIQKADGPQLFVYNVKNLNAEVLAQTANQVLLGGQLRDPASVIEAQARAARAGQPAGAAGPNGPSGNGAAALGDFVVDPLGNRLIFSGTSSEYERVLPMLKQLDVPPAEVLIEVMIAQVTLTDSTQFGVDWTIRNLSDNNLVGNASSALTDAGSGLSGIVSRGGFGPAGVAFGVFSPDVDVSIDAFAENSQVNILSTPRLVARSGSAATVQVGTDVPIITSQRAAPNQTGAGDLLDTLQTIEYRSTGIILNIEPVVFSDNRIDLTISQEVSSTSPPAAGAIPSPTINNTSVSTLLSLQDGATAVIGGLIQDTVNRNENGVPLLKDIPVVGNLFSSDSVSVDRTELVILITAYVLRSQADRDAFVERFTRDIDRTLSEDNLITLRPRHF
jgi:general secretion pathway protein D